MSECKHEWEWGERELACELCEQTANNLEIARLQAKIAELEEAAKDDYNRYEDSIVRLEAKIAELERTASDYLYDIIAPTHKREALIAALEGDK